MKTTCNHLLGFVCIAVLAVFALSPMARAGVDDVTLTWVKVTNAATFASDQGFVVRGEIIAVKVGITGGSAVTNTLTLSSADGQTLFTAACTGTNFYPLADVAYTTAGAAINSSTVAATTNRVYVPIPCASKVTGSIVGTISTTNTALVKIIFRN